MKKTRRRGRPAKPTEEKNVTIHASVPPEMAAHLMKLGEGSMSRAVQIVTAESIAMAKKGKK